MAQTTIEDALSKGGIIDITTTGRKTGQARRIEIYLHNLDGEFYLTGRPGFPRDWVANLAANPEMTVHLKRGLEADLPARGSVVGEPERKGKIIHRARVESWNANPDEARADLDHWIETAPLVQVFIDRGFSAEGSSPLPGCAGTPPAGGRNEKTSSTVQVTSVDVV